MTAGVTDRQTDIHTDIIKVLLNFKLFGDEKMKKIRSPKKKNLNPYRTTKKMTTLSY